MILKKEKILIKNKNTKINRAKFSHLKLDRTNLNIFSTIGNDLFLIKVQLYHLLKNIA